MGELRETLVALPSTHGDIYRRHQLVWRAMHGLVHTGQSFIFTSVSDHMVAVRSERLERGELSALSEGLMRVQLVAARRDGQRMRPIANAHMDDWVADLMALHGLRVHRVTVLADFMAAGSKRDAASGKTLAIQLPVKNVLIETTIEHRAKAALAWANGVGRGKRFGFGMLQRAE